MSEEREDFSVAGNERPAADGAALLSEASFWSESLRALSEAEAPVAATVHLRWSETARSAQTAPPGEWRNWLLVGGRGAGKTRAGAEWVRAMALGVGAASGGLRHGRIALIAETLADAREVMVDGESGLLKVCSGLKPTFEVSRRRLVFANGALAQLFSSEDPDSLRGYQFDAAWGDEVAKWAHPDAVFDNLQFALRLGARPRAVFTTTPRPVPLLRRLMGEPQTVVTRGATRENAEHLAPGFVDAMEARYGGTRLGRQELDGEFVDGREDALFDRDLIEERRLLRPPELARIVVAVDPPASSGPRSDACGIVAAGKGRDDTIYVLEDASVRAAKPHEWARIVTRLAEKIGADRIIAETNQGGEMVEAVIRAADPDASLRCVNASRSKWVRTEPVAALYERGRVRHAGRFPELEDEMADFGPDGLSGGRSPDRLDALVWAVTALTGPESDPRIRSL